MRAAWFAKTADFNPNAVTLQQDQEKKVNDLKLIFKGVAEEYQRELAEEREASTPSIPSASTSAQPLQRSGSSGSFLADFCDVPNIVPIEVPTITPAAALKDELDRYWQFEGGRGDLFDPLGWWEVCKMCSSVSTCRLKGIHIGKCCSLPCTLTDGSGLPGNPCHQCLR